MGVVVVGVVVISNSRGQPAQAEQAANALPPSPASGSAAANAQAANPTAATNLPASTSRDSGSQGNGPRATGSQATGSQGGSSQGGSSMAPIPPASIASFGASPSAYVAIETPWVTPSVVDGSFPEVQSQSGFEKVMTAASAPTSGAPVKIQTSSSRPTDTNPHGGSDETVIKQLAKRASLIECELPAHPWRAAYDPVSGNLLLSNDRHGFLTYSVNSIAAKKAAPTTIFPVIGVPSAACLKPSEKGNLFVLTGSHDAFLYVVKADSGEPVARIPLEMNSTILHIASSSDPTDPYVYVISNVPNGVFESDSPGEFRPGGILGRVNIETGQQEYHDDLKCVHVTVSPDGKSLCVAENGLFLCTSWIEWRSIPRGSMLHTFASFSSSWTIRHLPIALRDCLRWATNS